MDAGQQTSGERDEQRMRVGFVCLGSMFVGGVTVTASQGMNMVMLVLKGMYMAFVGEGCQSQGKRRREIAMVAMSNLDSSFVI